MKKNIVVCGLITGLLGTASVLADMYVDSTDTHTQQGIEVSLPRTQLEHLEQLANYGNVMKERLGEKVKLLSVGNQRLIGLGEKRDKLKPVLEKVMEKGSSPRKASQYNIFTPGSDFNSSDDFLSRFAGMTQSETSSAWCGTNAIIAFNDSGSFMRTFIDPAACGDFSFIGWSRSINPATAAPTFIDKGIMTPHPNPQGIVFQDLMGDVKTACASQRFYCSSTSTLYKRTFSGGFVIQSAISVVRSLDGGETFGSAVPAAQKPTGGYPSYVLDKPWMAVKPGNSAATDTIYVTYTSINPSLDTIEFVKSVNGGAAWSAPIVIGTAPSYSGIVQGSQVAFSPLPAPNGTIYVTWEEYDTFPCGDRRIKIRKSTDNGDTFSAPVQVTDIVGCGDGFRMQGNFSNFMDNSGLAVNPKNGNVYVAYQDGRGPSLPDSFGECGYYNFSNIYFRRSTDGGSTWTNPVKVNSDSANAKIDQFMPGIAVEKNTGRILVTFYDRRHDIKRNFTIRFWRAISTDSGNTWTNQSSMSGAFPAITGWEDDLFDDHYMSNYEAPSSDSAGTSTSGFITNWSDNTLGDANIQFQKIP